MSVPSFCEVNFLVHSVSLVSIGSAQGWVNSARIKAVFDHEQLRYVNLSIKRIWMKEWDLFESVRVQLGLLAYGFNKRLCLYRWVCRWRNLNIFVLLFQIIETPLDWFMWRWSYGKKNGPDNAITLAQFLYWQCWRFTFFIYTQKRSL